MSLHIFSAEAVSAALSHADCIVAMRQAMMAVSSGETVLPLRQFMAVPGTQGKQGLMPGYLKGASASHFGVKIVAKFPRAPGSALGTHVGAVMLFDAADGAPLALFDGGRLTAIRTASATALASDVLARKDAKTVLFLGHGEEADHHIPALLAVRSVKRFLIWGRTPERAQTFVDAQAAKLPDAVVIERADDLPAAVAQADIICTLTSATTPILKGAWLKPGVHVNLVGAAVATSAEADTDVVVQSRFYTDYKPSLDAQGGEWIAAKEQALVTDAHLVGEIGAVIAGLAPGRQSPDDITVYKSLGVAAQDLAAGVAALAAGRAKGVGQIVEW